MFKRVLFLGLAVLVATSVTAQAEMLNKDGDFGAQTLGAPVVKVGDIFDGFCLGICRWPLSG